MKMNYNLCNKFIVVGLCFVNNYIIIISPIDSIARYNILRSHALVSYTACHN